MFLGANQDSYAEAHDLAMASGNTSNFAASSAGVHKAFAGTSRATREWRGKSRVDRLATNSEFWGDTKEAEES